MEIDGKLTFAQLRTRHTRAPEPGPLLPTVHSLRMTSRQVHAKKSADPLEDMASQAMTDRGLFRSHSLHAGPLSTRLHVTSHEQLSTQLAAAV
jgi:hypothetical protein